tara:strand:+ start:1349 stop:1648 length:300 start_codon:yes stop_codon:yes gene_type:complete
MAAIINASIDVSKLPKEKFVKGKDGRVWYRFTIAVNDDTRYGNNVSLSDSQTKEEREAKAKKNFFGNGQVVWTNNEIKLAEKEQKLDIISKNESSDLPF